MNGDDPDYIQNDTPSREKSKNSGKLGGKTRSVNATSQVRFAYGHPNDLINDQAKVNSSQILNSNPEYNPSDSYPMDPNQKIQKH